MHTSLMVHCGGSFRLSSQFNNLVDAALDDLQVGKKYVIHRKLPTVYPCFAPSNIYK